MQAPLKQFRRAVMSNFALVPSSYDFHIGRDRRGHWIVSERHNLSGGVFLTRKDAIRFALFEAGGDPSHVHTHRGARPHLGRT